MECIEPTEHKMLENVRYFSFGWISTALISVSKKIPPVNSSVRMLEYVKNENNYYRRNDCLEDNKIFDLH